MRPVEAAGRKKVRPRAGADAAGRNLKNA
jgi:hypothetical protein